MNVFNTALAVLYEEGAPRYSRPVIEEMNKINPFYLVISGPKNVQYLKMI